MLLLGVCMQASHPLYHGGALSILQHIRKTACKQLLSMSCSPELLVTAEDGPALILPPPMHGEEASAKTLTGSASSADHEDGVITGKSPSQALHPVQNKAANACWLASHVPCTAHDAGGGSASSLPSPDQSHFNDDEVSPSRWSQSQQSVGQSALQAGVVSLSWPSTSTAGHLPWEVEGISHRIRNQHIQARVAQVQRVSTRLLQQRIRFKKMATSRRMRWWRSVPVNHILQQLQSWQEPVSHHSFSTAIHPYSAPLQQLPGQQPTNVQQEPAGMPQCARAETHTPVQEEQLTKQPQPFLPQAISTVGWQALQPGKAAADQVQSGVSVAPALHADAAEQPELGDLAAAGPQANSAAPSSTAMNMHAPDAAVPAPASARRCRMQVCGTSEECILLETLSKVVPATFPLQAAVKLHRDRKQLYGCSATLAPTVPTGSGVNRKGSAQERSKGVQLQGPAQREESQGPQQHGPAQEGKCSGAQQNSLAQETTQKVGQLRSSVQKEAAKGAQCNGLVQAGEPDGAQQQGSLREVEPKEGQQEGLPQENGCKGIQKKGPIQEQGSKGAQQKGPAGKQRRKAGQQTAYVQAGGSEMANQHDPAVHSGLTGCQQRGPLREAQDKEAEQKSCQDPADSGAVAPHGVQQVNAAEDGLCTADLGAPCGLLQRVPLLPAAPVRQGAQRAAGLAWLAAHAVQQLAKGGSPHGRGHTTGAAAQDTLNALCTEEQVRQALQKFVTVSRCDPASKTRGSCPGQGGLLQVIGLRQLPAGMPECQAITDVGQHDQVQAMKRAGLSVLHCAQSTVVRRDVQSPAAAQSHTGHVCLGPQGTKGLQAGNTPGSTGQVSSTWGVQSCFQAQPINAGSQEVLREARAGSSCTTGQGCGTSLGPGVAAGAPIQCAGHTGRPRDMKLLGAAAAAESADSRSVGASAAVQSSADGTASGMEGAAAAGCKDRADDAVARAAPAIAPAPAVQEAAGCAAVDAGTAAATQAVALKALIVQKIQTMKPLVRHARRLLLHRSVLSRTLQSCMPNLPSVSVAAPAEEPTEGFWWPPYSMRVRLAAVAEAASGSGAMTLQHRGECLRDARTLRNAAVLQLHEQWKEEARLAREAATQARLQALKANDMDAYLQLVQQERGHKLNEVLAQTDQCLHKLSHRLPKRIAAPLLEQMTGGGDAARGSKLDAFKHTNTAWSSLAMMQADIPEQPRMLTGGRLHQYQLQGLRWMAGLREAGLNGILADEMGVGKTVQVLSLLCYWKESCQERLPSLVLVPASVLPNWEAEAAAWAPALQLLVYKGTVTEREELYRAQLLPKNFDVLLTTYELAMGKVDRPRLAAQPYACLIVDEGHRLKNAKCKLHAELKCYKTQQRLLLTGTPVQNNMEELWSLLNFILPDIFGSADEFEQWFGGMMSRLGAEEASLTEEEQLLVTSRLHQVLSPFMLRRLKSDVLGKLPKKVEYVLRCPPSLYQQHLCSLVGRQLNVCSTSEPPLQPGTNILMDRSSQHNSALEQCPAQNNSGCDSQDGELLSLKHKQSGSCQTSGGCSSSNADMQGRENSRRGKKRGRSELERLLADAQAASGAASKAVGINNAAMELRCISNHPFLSKLHEEGSECDLPRHELPPAVRLSGKMEVLDRLLIRLKQLGSKVLLFSTMTKLLDIVAEYMDWRGWQWSRLDGATKQQERGDIVRQFNDSGSDVFVLLLSLRAGGVGLNLQAADTVIMYDSDWNPQIDLQAQARAHRMGQQRDVRVIRLLTAGSIEEHILAVAQAKKGMAEKSITGGFFDGQTSAEARRAFLLKLLRQEAAASVATPTLADRSSVTDEELDVICHGGTTTPAHGADVMATSIAFAATGDCSHEAQLMSAQPSSDNPQPCKSADGSQQGIPIQPYSESARCNDKAVGMTGAVQTAPRDLSGPGNSHLDLPVFITAPPDDNGTNLHNKIDVALPSVADGNPSHTTTGAGPCHTAAATVQSHVTIDASSAAHVDRKRKHAGGASSKGGDAKQDKGHGGQQQNRLASAQESAALMAAATSKAFPAAKLTGSSSSRGRRK